MTMSKIIYADKIMFFYTAAKISSCNSNYGNLEVCDIIKKAVLEQTRTTLIFLLFLLASYI